MSSDQQLFIMELTKSQIELMAQLVHIHLQTEYASDTGRRLLKELVNQTTAVLDSHEHHNVFKPFKALPLKSKVVPKLFFTPFQDP